MRHLLDLLREEEPFFFMRNEEVSLLDFFLSYKKNSKVNNGVLV